MKQYHIMGLAFVLIAEELLGGTSTIMTSLPGFSVGVIMSVMIYSMPTLAGDIVVPPSIQSIVPDNGAINVDQDSSIVIKFNGFIRNIDNSEIDSDDLQSILIFKKDNASGVDVAFTASIIANEKKITLTPTNLLELGSTYYLAITDQVESYEDVPFAGTNITFITDGVIPAIHSIVPDNGAINVALESSIVIKFDDFIRNIDNSEIDSDDLQSILIFKIDNASGIDVAFTATIIANEKKITLTPTNLLELGATYYLAITDQVESYEDVPFAGTNITFTTYGINAPALENGLNFVDDLSTNGITKIILGSHSTSGVSYAYKISSDSNPVSTPYVNEVITLGQDWNVVTNNGLISVANDTNIGVVELDANNKVIQFSNAKSVVVAIVIPPPEVDTITPINGATNVAVDSTITFEFSEAIRNIDDSAIDATDLQSFITFKIDNSSGADVPFTGVISQDKMTVTISSNSNLTRETTYYLSLSTQVENVGDVAFEGISTTFTTRPNLDIYIDSSDGYKIKYTEQATGTYYYIVAPASEITAPEDAETIVVNAESFISGTIPQNYLVGKFTTTNDAFEHEVVLTPLLSITNYNGYIAFKDTTLNVWSEIVVSNFTAPGITSPALTNGLSFVDDLSTNGITKIILGSHSTSGVSYAYKISSDSNPVSTPYVNEVITLGQDWNVVTNNGLISVANDTNIGVVELDANNKVIQFSNAKSVVVAIVIPPEVDTIKPYVAPYAVEFVGLTKIEVDFQINTDVKIYYSILSNSEDLSSITNEDVKNGIEAIETGILDETSNNGVTRIIDYSMSSQNYLSNTYQIAVATYEVGSEEFYLEPQVFSISNVDYDMAVTHNDDVELKPVPGLLDSNEEVVQTQTLVENSNEVLFKIQPIIGASADVDPELVLIKNSEIEGLNYDQIVTKLNNELDTLIETKDAYKVQITPDIVEYDLSAVLNPGIYSALLRNNDVGDVNQGEISLHPLEYASIISSEIALRDNNDDEPIQTPTPTPVVVEKASEVIEMFDNIVINLGNSDEVNNTLDRFAEVLNNIDNSKDAEQSVGIISNIIDDVNEEVKNLNKEEQIEAVENIVSLLDNIGKNLSLVSDDVDKAALVKDIIINTKNVMNELQNTQTNANDRTQINQLNNKLVDLANKAIQEESKIVLKDTGLIIISDIEKSLEKAKNAKVQLEQTLKDVGINQEVKSLQINIIVKINDESKVFKQMDFQKDVIAKLSDEVDNLELDFGNTGMQISSEVLSAIGNNMLFTTEDLESTNNEPKPDGHEDEDIQIRQVNVYEGDDEVIEFVKPVKVSFDIKDFGIDTSSKEEIAQLVVMVLNEETGEWTPTGGMYNEVTGNIEFYRIHMSKYTVVKNNKKFTDVDNSWAKDEINNLLGKGIADVNAEFKPDETITREEFAAWICRAYGLNEENDSETFIDIDKSNPYYNEISNATKQGLVFGRTAEEFAPKETITREEMATLVARAISNYNDVKTPDSGAQRFASLTNEENTSDWAIGNVALVIDMGIMEMDENGNFNPKDPISKEAAADIFAKLYK